MKLAVKRVVVAGSILVVAGVALATPIVGLVSPLISTGASAGAASVSGTGLTGSGESFTVALDASGPAAFTTQDASIAAGGHNGWHSHPGLVAVTVVSGEIDWYDENCQKTTYNTGASWIEGSALHYFRVIGTTPVHLIAWFVTAPGVPLRTDQPAPPCAAALKLT